MPSTVALFRPPRNPPGQAGELVELLAVAGELVELLAVAGRRGR
jgi:hypothetical protein